MTSQSVLGRATFVRISIHEVDSDASGSLGIMLLFEKKLPIGQLRRSDGS